EQLGIAERGGSEFFQPFLRALAGGQGFETVFRIWCRSWTAHAAGEPGLCSASRQTFLRPHPSGSRLGMGLEKRPDRLGGVEVAADVSDHGTGRVLHPIGPG